MESFINALARAQDNVWTAAQARPVPTDGPRLKISETVLTLSSKTLKANRVVSFDGADSVTRAFDVLRNTCMKDLALRVADRPIFGVTSPSVGCGASTTAINLAFSLARQQKGNVMFADLSLPGEEWWNTLRRGKAMSEPSGNRDTVYRLDAAGTMIYSTSLLPVVVGKSGSEIGQPLQDWITSVGRDLGPVSIVLDLPPLLSDDRVSSIISEVDTVLLVLATGKSTLAELETSKSYLHDAASVQLVLNKARDYDI